MADRRGDRDRDRDRDSEAIARLAAAIQRKTRSEVARLLAELDNDRLNCLTQDGQTLLHVAIRHRNLEAIAVLLTKGASPNITDKDGRTALHAIAEVDNVLPLADVLDKCVSLAGSQAAEERTVTSHTRAIINSLDKNGYSALHVAVQKSSVETIKWLMFCGANPDLKNNEGLPCRLLTKSFFVRGLLKDVNIERPTMSIMTLEKGKPVIPQDTPFILLPSSLPSEAEAAFLPKFVFFAVSHQQVSAERRVSIKEEEDMLTPALDYRLSYGLHVHLTLLLSEVPEDFYELVLRLDNSESNDQQNIVLSIKEGLPSESLRQKLRSGANIISACVAYAEVTLQLPEAGLLIMLVRPTVQEVTLQKGHTCVQSKMDPRVAVSVPQNYQGCLQAELQLEPSVPIHTDPALSHATSNVEELQSQTDYFKLRSPSKSSDESRDVTVSVPVPSDFVGGEVHVYFRTNSTDSSKEKQSSATPAIYPVPVAAPTYPQGSVSRSMSETSDYSSISGSESETDDIESEVRRWVKDQVIKLPKESKTIKFSSVTNKTMTAVEVKPSVADEKVKRRLAKQYRKRKLKKAIFLVACRPWAGWRECREVTLVVTSPKHLPKELERSLVDGYNLLAVSGNLLVPAMTQFRVTHVGDLFVEDGKPEGSVQFDYALNPTELMRTRMKQTEAGQNRFTLVLRVVKRDKSGPHEQLGRFRIQQRKANRKGAKGGTLWKDMGELPFDMSGVTQDLKDARSQESPEEQELSQYFTHKLLLELAEKLPPMEAAQFGIRLGLSSTQIDDVLFSPYYYSPVYKCCEIMRRHRDHSSEAVTFARTLVLALQEMGWNQQCEWLLARLKHWPRLSAVDVKTTG